MNGPPYKRLERLAKRTGKPVTDLVNQLLKRDRSYWKAYPNARPSGFAREDIALAMKVRDQVKDALEIEEDRVLLNLVVVDDNV